MSGDFYIKTNSVTQKPWETSHFGHLVEQIDVELEPKKKRFEYTLVDSGDVKLIQTLEEDSWKYLMSVVDMTKEPTIFSGFWISKYIREATAVDLDQLKEIAETSFNKTRLHSSVDHRTANLMHKDWVINCLNKSQADNVYVYSDSGIVKGFIATRVRNHVGEIVLIAVDRKFRGFGIGTELVDFSCIMMSETSTEIKVRTELPNLSAIRMYEKCGFHTTGSYLYMGKWYD